MKSTFMSGLSLARASVLLAAMCVAAPLAYGQTLSAAEQAALDALQPVDQAQKMLSICHHVLLHGGEAKKSNLLATLGTKTCAEAIAEGLFDAPAP